MWGKYIAAILVLLGLFPVIGRAFTTIPSPVLGGAMVLIFWPDCDCRRAFWSATVFAVVKQLSRRLLSVWVWAWHLSGVFKNLPVLFPKLNFRRRYYGSIVELGLPEDKTDKAVKVEPIVWSTGQALFKRAV